MKQTLLLFLIAASFFAIAQPTINSNVIASPGYVYYYLKSNNVNTFTGGSIGANITWNFTTLDTSLGTFTQRMVQADTTLYYSDFPSLVNRANQATGLGGTNIYGYAFLDNTKYEYYGAEGLGYQQIFTDPQKQLQFPFTYNNQFTDYFHDADSTYFGKVTVKADAYGTLQLPTGTYSNALRIKYKEDYRQYTDWDFDGNPIDSTMYDGLYYRWYLPNIVAPVLEYSKLVSYQTYQGTRYDIDSLKHLVVRKGNVSTGIEEKIDDITMFLYPNPATNQLNIFTGSTENTSTIIFDLQGNAVIQNTNSKTIDVSALPRGIYIAEIKLGYAVVRKRWVKM